MFGEDMNDNILKVQKIMLETILEENIRSQYNKIMKIKQILKVEIWSDIRFLMVNKAITPGEITELIRMQMEIDKDINKWLEAIRKAISANR